MRAAENVTLMVPVIDEVFEVEEPSPDSALPRALRESIRRAPARARRGWVHREIRRSIRRVAE
ncbi:MAG: hypothetical protein KIT84_18140 [Labilithrix sp.]|nr:hypothetical protein [Labilithrix sp.]MCW5812953.1 hypothetical protein [Labilithrix sp.]